MWTIRGKHGRRELRTTVMIIDEAKRLKQAQLRAPLYRDVKRYQGLIDTGATITMMSQGVIAELSLTPVGLVNLNAVSGNSPYLTYLFSVAFVGEGIPGWQANRPDLPATTIFSKIHILRAPVIGGALKHKAVFDVLLGMDVISTGRLEVDGSEFSFTYS